MKLREYQLKSIAKIRHEFNTGNRSLILQLPTGAGKTVIFTAIAKQASEKGSRVLVITDRKELLTQAGGTFDHFGLKAELLTAETKRLKDAAIYIAMVETIKRRLNKTDYIDFVQSFNLIIIDEAHKQSFDRLFESITPFQYVIGATATPYRTGKMKPLSENYSGIVIGEQIPELIAANYLSDCVPYGVPIAGLEKVRIKGGEFDAGDMGKLYDNPVLFGGVIENYMAYAEGRKALLFAATVANAERMSLELKAAGISSAYIEANTPKEIRAVTLEDFKAGRFQVLCNVGILTTGYDEPSISCIITYRATRSLPLWLQMCGRGSRIHEGKKDFVILDFGENAKRHGGWDDERFWSLENAKPPQKVGAALMKECGGCRALIPANAQTCKYCGFEKLVLEVKDDPIKVMLQKMTGDQIKRYKWDGVYEMEKVREAKGYNIGWVLHRLRTIAEFEDYGRLKGYKRGWAYHAAQRYIKK